MKDEFKVFVVVAGLLLTAFFLLSCSSQSEIKPNGVAPTPTTDTDDPRIIESDLGSDGVIEPWIPPFEEHDLMALATFFVTGIDMFYDVHRRVPVDFEEYLESGIPMLIPNDYATGEPYYLVDELDMDDTRGFTFWSDGEDSCIFELVIYNIWTEENEVFTSDFDEDDWRDYKTVDDVPGIRANTTIDFDNTKLNYSVIFFTDYSHFYAFKYGGAPSSLYQMLSGKGDPIEAGWQWEPDEAYYFEFGINPDKQRYYTRQGCCTLVVSYIYEEPKDAEDYIQGVDEWFFFDPEEIPPSEDIIVMDPYITSDSFYDGYLQLTNN